jgi:hypothetical protein
MSSVFARTFDRILWSGTRIDASRAAHSFSCYRRRVEVLILTRCFPPFIISSLFFVSVYSSVMIVVARASSMSGSFWVVSRVARSCPLFCSILLPQLPPRAPASLPLVEGGSTLSLIVALLSAYVIFFSNL